MFSANEKGNMPAEEDAEDGNWIDDSEDEFCMASCIDKFSLVRLALYSKILARNLPAEVPAEEPDALQMLVYYVFIT